jgi:hypothetical protein
LAKDKTQSLEDQLGKQFSDAEQALKDIRETWDDKEAALLAQVSDSISGNITRARVTDAGLSTLAYERQARVAAQLPTGKVYGAGKKDEAKAKLGNIVLHRYIIPNANSQFDMLIKQRMWGVYASVYGSMPMLYDYRVDDQYIGPDCWLIDPRDFFPQPGFNSISDCDWVMISTEVSVSDLKKIVKRKNTTYNTKALQKLIDDATSDAKPSKDDNAKRTSLVNKHRYNKDTAKGRIELVTKYEKGDDGHWITFAPDFDNIVIRDIKNPHKSGRIPVVLRHCFPLMNSIFGLGDFDRGMKLQKAKDSLTNLFLEGAKMRVFPPTKIDTSKVTPSTIKLQANAKWLMSDLNAVQPYSFGNQPLAEFQATYSSLHTMLMNQFGTTDTTTNQDQSGNPTYGKTPQALKMLETRENARDTWDRFMHEKAVEELYEGMLNLLTVKMEKPINFTIFEEEIRQLANEYQDTKILEVLENGKYGAMTLAKSDLKSDKNYCYIIDANSSMRQDDQSQNESLIGLLQVMSNPAVLEGLQARGIDWDVAEHIKSIFISAGVNDWERILKDGQQQGMQGQDPMAEQAMQEQMMQEEAIKQQAMEQVNQVPPELEQLFNEVGITGVQNG